MGANADVINGAYEAFAAGDVPRIVEACDPAVRWESTEALPQGGSYSGPEGVQQFFEQVGGNWDGLEVEMDKVLESGDHVIGIGRASGKLRDGDTAAGYGFVHVFELGDGKITGFDEYAAPDETVRSS